MPFTVEVVMQKWFDKLNAAFVSAVQLAVNIAVIIALVNVANSFRTNNVSQEDLDTFEVRVEANTDAQLGEFRVDVDARFEAVDGRLDRHESLLTNSTTQQGNP